MHFYGTTLEKTCGQSLDKTACVPLARQLYRRIKAQILSGHLRAGEKLPSSRKLAETVRVSRNTVLEAYDLLLAEGYLETRSSSGTRVASGIAGLQPESPGPRGTACGHISPAR